MVAGGEYRAMTVPPSGVIASFDRVLPAGSFSSPAAGNVSAVITLAVSPTDNDRVASVQFKLDGSNIGAPVGSPFQINHDTRAVQNGAHTYSAVITDRVGNQTTISRAVTMVNIPVVSMTSPGSGATVSGTITIGANVTIYDPSVSVQFQVDGGNQQGAQGGAGGHSISYDTHYLANGWHTFGCVATDSHSNVGSASISAYVNNTPPATGVTLLDEIKVWDDGTGNYQGQRTHIEPADGTGGNWIWSATGAKGTSVYFPGNPDPTHYQMRAWAHVDRFEGGTDGNVVHLDYLVGGTWYGFGNPSAYSNFALLQNINGGEALWGKRWQERADWNTGFCQGFGGYYDFVPKAPYNS
jgi:hypothetical protein